MDTHRTTPDSEEEKWLRSKGWIENSIGHWQKMGAFIDGALTLEDAIKLEKIMESWWNEGSN